MLKILENKNNTEMTNKAKHKKMSEWHVTLEKDFYSTIKMYEFNPQKKYVRI